MYSTFQIVKKYFHYYLHASNGKGHGIHSPFVFDFIKNVLNDNKKYSCYAVIEKERKKLLSDKNVIEIVDYGAGSSVMSTNTRAINKIAASSLKPKKYARLLFRIARYYRPGTIIELGTSFGITTSYLASADPGHLVYTLEGSDSIALIAKQNFEALGLKNVQLLNGDFAKTLRELFSLVNQTGLAFIDGNHRKRPTIENFHELLKISTTSTIMVFDDIHWSAEMEDAWKEIRQHPAVTCTIDVFFMGIVFLNNDFKVKQHFSIRF